MAVAAPSQLVAPPVASPPLHGLAAIAQTIAEPDDRWVNGLSFEPDTCEWGAPWPVDCLPLPHDDLDALYSWTGDTWGTECVDYQPFGLAFAVQRPTIGRRYSDLSAAAIRGLVATTSRQLEAEFWTGTVVPANPHLDDTGATLVDTAALTPSKALAGLVGALGNFAGGRGVIHARPEIVALWADGGGLIDIEAGKLVTKVGRHFVSSGGGYPGTGPTGHGVSEPAKSQWAFATTGPLHLRITDALVESSESDAFDRAHNRFDVIATRVAAVTWDTCGRYAVCVDGGVPSQDHAP
jgi:hypothetical protein